MMFMGSKNIIFVMFFVWLSPLFIRWTLAVENSYDPHSLDDFIHDYAQKAVKMPHTGTLYSISIPSNYSGMEISFVRLRSASFWVRGTNSSLFHIPPRIIPLPFVKRLDIVFQNLGNWSSYYYNVQNYTFVTPITGLTTYNGDSTNSSANRSLMLDLSLHGGPIVVRFPNISLEKSGNATFKCVRFDTNGTTEFGNVTMPNLCKFRGQGHFSIVVPSLQPPWEDKREEKRKWKWKWKWWVTVFGVGVGGSVVLVLVGILVWKMVRVKKIEGMEKQAEKSEALDTVWVGRSKMPSASGIRTQPVLEDDYIP